MSIDHINNGELGLSVRQKLNALIDLFGQDATTDSAPGAASMHGGNAYPQATGENQTGADLNLSGGIGSRFFTVVDFSALGGSAVIIITNGVSVTLTEGVEWTAATSNAATATSLAAAIGATASVVGAIVYITPASTARTLTISTENAGANLTATSGESGQVIVVPAAQNVYTGASPTLLSFAKGNVFLVTTTGEVGTEIIRLPDADGVEDGTECTIIYNRGFPGENLTVLRIDRPGGQQIRHCLLPPLSGDVLFDSMDLEDFGVATFRAADNGGTWYLTSCCVHAIDLAFNGLLLSAEFPTADQNDGTTIWCDTAADRVLKLSSPP